MVIGSTQEADVVQIDNDHINACKEMTSILVMKGIRKMALIGGSATHVVNNTRRKGFEEGLLSQGITPDSDLFYMNNETNMDVERSVDSALVAGAECLVCMDDRICHAALRKLHEDNMVIPDDIRIVSFYNSDLLADNQPAITALQYDPKELGNVACKKLLKIIEGEEVEKKTFLGYEVLLRGSTR